MVLRVRKVSKSFPGVKALQDVSLEAEKGQVLALAGENGAGKSTLMKILIGLHAPDSGEILLEGCGIRPSSPHDALRAGISMIHQELMPFPDLSVAENICMGREPARWLPGWLDRPAMQRTAERLLARLGVELDPRRKMRELSVAEMQAVEIAKALAGEAKVIIMDEPTSALSEREAGALFGVIGELKKRGVAVIYISHKLDEIFRLGDQVTVLRDGRHVATRAIGELNQDRLIALMVGREIGAVFPPPAAAKGDVVLEARGLGRAGRFRDASFQLRRGEIVGLAGLMGAGRTDLLGALAGLAPAERGEILVRGRQVRIGGPWDALAHGIALVGEDRKETGLVPEMSIRHNLTLSSLRGWRIDHAAECRVADEQIRAFAIKPPDRDRLAGRLSGGNQQKLVIAKALLTDPAILLLDEPTRGIDIGAKAEVYEIVSRLAREGKAILMASSEMPELLALCDRILVLRQGEIAAELNPRETSQEEILKCAMPN
ncbi:MAG: sugar ABC transporter ATP-binding protein [Acidobacteria bacterium]|nr:sugar ABC transporter ATP-binding protein [Acidobacteriota bacterium]